MKYKGGPLGIYALADAFNPWDICKMTARGLRWLFIGARKRHEDMSYQNPKQMDPAYAGPTFAGTGEAATELRPSKDAESRGRPNTYGADDRQGLLRHSGQMGRMVDPSPYRNYANDDYGESQVDLGRPPQQQQAPPGTAVSTAGLDAKPSEFMDEETSYRLAYAPTSSAAAGAGAGAQGLDGASVHPAFRFSGQRQWGEEQRQWSDQDSIRPPTYHTADPHR